MGTPLWTTHAEIVGADRLVRLLADLGPKAGKKWAKRGVTKAARVVRRAARDQVAVETGTLKKSIDYKVYAYKNGAGAGAVIGPARGYKRPVTARKRGGMRAMTKREIARAEQNGDTLQYRDPTKYAHLVEYGHRVARGGTLIRLRGKSRGKAPRSRTGRTGQGRVAGSAAPRPFMRPAWSATKAECERIIAEELRKGLEEDARGR